MQDEQAATLRDYSQIKQIDYCADLSVNDFVDRYMSRNIPVLLGSKFTSNWTARKEWVERQPISSERRPVPDFDELHGRFGGESGNVKVMVADCESREYSDQPRIEMSFGEYIQHWRQQQQSSHTGEFDSTKANKRLLYLKDWHCSLSVPSRSSESAPVLPHFSDDWMDEFCAATTCANKDAKDDFRFVYMGSDGTWTPFHADVYRSFSWSSNICGIKVWVMFPPGQEQLYASSSSPSDGILSEMVYDARSSVQTNAEFPLLGAAKRFVVVQRPGQTLFVPSSWHHQVINVGATISINRNWCNAHNIDMVWSSIRSDCRTVEQSIGDLKEMLYETQPDEWFGTCEQLLKSHAGINLGELLDLLSHMAKVWLGIVKRSDTACALADEFATSSYRQQCLARIKNILEQLAAEEYIQRYHSDKVQSLLSLIDNELKVRN
ncbi:Clavaminate synthase-like protein [Ramicandelaber brevisporus]|nr:Clavaminate synthase-like protein [Ramicandelaber brevisporus]